MIQVVTYSPHASVSLSVKWIEEQCLPVVDEIVFPQKFCLPGTLECDHNWKWVSAERVSENEAIMDLDCAKSRNWSANKEREGHR